jgi:uncharacterized protein YdhG (YjbR/CyaY superfamily)
VTGAEDVDAYVAALPEPARAAVEELRRRARRVIPGGEESISYGIPTVKLDGRPVVYFAGYAGHVSLHPVLDELDEELAGDVAPYRSGRGTLKMPLRDPVPFDLAERVMRALLARRQSA